MSVVIAHTFTGIVNVDKTYSRCNEGSSWECNGRSRTAGAKLAKMYEFVPRGVNVVCDHSDNVQISDAKHRNREKVVRSSSE